MKVLICCLNSKYIHASLAPWCLYSSSKETNKAIDYFVYESTINNTNEAIVNKILEEDYKIISFSCYIWNIEKTLEICKELKAKTNATIVLGGPEVSYRAKNVLSLYPFVDFVLSGEGEETYPLLTKALTENTSYKKIDGLSYRENGVIISNPEKEYTGTPVTPYCDEYFENLQSRISYIEASRGCPYNCAFCLSGRCSDLRHFDTERVKSDILRLSVGGSKTIKFVDRTFNANYKKCDEILTFILENHKKEIPEGVCFHFEIAGDILKQSTMDIFKSAPQGLFQLEIGMQSFNEDTLKAINRKTDTKRLIENIKTLISFNNMHIHIDLIAGLPLENMESFRRSFNIGYCLGANMLQMGFLKVLHGAEMRENKEKYPCTFTESAPYQVTSTPWLTEKEINALHNCEDALERMYNSGRFLYTLEYLIDEIGFEPFELFYNFGNTVKVDKISLSDYAGEIYNYFYNKADSEILREKLICDLLSSSSALQIPDFLKRKDSKYKQIKKHFMTPENQQIKIAILYKQNKVFAVDQKKPKGFNGRYTGTFYSLSDFDILFD